MELQRTPDVDTSFDDAFEQRWARVQRIGTAVLAAFVITAACGAFGRGPLAQTRTSTPDGAVTIAYEDIARNRTPSTATIDVVGAATAGRFIDVRVSASLIPGLQTYEIVPRPVAERAAGDDIVFTFAHAGTAQIRLPYEPVAAGPVTGTIGVGDEPSLPVHTLVFP